MAGRMKRGEIWMIDLGLAAKVRPALILSVHFEKTKKLSSPTLPGAHSAEGAGSRLSTMLRIFCPAFSMRRMLAPCPSVN